MSGSAVIPLTCNLCGAVMLGSAAVVHHLIDHVNTGGCDARWTGDGRSWHLCTGSEIHDEPHRCRCGAVLVPAPPAE